MKSRPLVAICIMIILLNIDILSSIAVAQSDKSDKIDQRNIILKPGMTGGYVISDDFDVGDDIRAQITVDTSYSNGILFYNLTNDFKVIKNGIVRDKVEFIFTYNYEGGGCVMELVNIGNVTLKYNLLMDLDISKTINILVISLIIIGGIAVVSICIYLKFFRKKKENIKKPIPKAKTKKKKDEDLDTVMNKSENIKSNDYYEVEEISDEIPNVKTK